MKLVLKSILSTIFIISTIYASEEIPTQEEVAKLYVATFNRAPDKAGLDYWVNSGNKLSAIAQSFFDQEETKALYPISRSNRDFVNSVYQNLFNRVPDTAGWDYWENELNTGAFSKNRFIEAVMNGAKDDATSSDATTLNNKKSVGVYFAQAGLDDTTEARSIMSGVTAEITTVNTAFTTITSHPNKTIDKDVNNNNQETCNEDYQTITNGRCVLKTCETDAYACPTCESNEELKYFNNGFGYCKDIDSVGIAGDNSLDLVLDNIREKYGLPALTALMLHDGNIIEKSAVGKRSIGSSAQVTVDDKWHMGSITKTMTSTLAALLVKEGVIDWNSTISDIYPELVNVMKPEYKDVRFDELLSHRSGIPNELPDHSLYYFDKREISVQRLEFIEKVLKLPSKTTRGVYEYNNTGYIVAGTMLERVTGINWEKLMQIYIFDPLLMTHTGFGAPVTDANFTQPVGHKLLDDNWIPILPWDESIASDNATIFGPAGTVHTTLDDIAAFMEMHLQGLRGESVNGLLSSLELKKLYEPFPNSNYALGWVVVSDKIIHHSGSNTYWYATIYLDAEKNLAIFIAMNASDYAEKGNDGNSVKAMQELLTALSTRASATFK